MLNQPKPKINFLSPVREGHPRWRRRQIARALLFVLILGVAGLFTLSAAAPGEDLSPLLAELSPRALLVGVGRLILSGDRRLRGSAEDRVNILVMGIGGEGHDGPNLADTILIISLKPSTGQAALLSVPRDLVVEIPGYGWRKVNSVNAFAEANSPGSGGRASAEVLSKFLGVPIQYYLRIDFAGFKKFIDALGGVLVYVERSFSDSEYPTADHLTEAVSFSSGWQRMNGSRALIYSRSRHGTGGEGSDFARSRRQQRVIIAVKEELMNAGLLANPAKIAELFGIAAAHLETNVELSELLLFANLAKNIDQNRTIRRTLEPEAGGPLVAALVDGAYVLLPKSGNYEDIKQVAREIFSEPSTRTGEAGGEPQLKTVKIEIQNGTTLTGFAGRAAQTLAEKGFVISYVGNTQSRGYERTVIYDLSGGRYPEDLLRLRLLLDADVSLTIPEWWSAATVPPQVTVNPPATVGGRTDFLVILGRSSAGLLNSS